MLREPNTIAKKNKDAVRERDNLYTKHNRLSMKLNDPAKNAEILKKQRLAKAEYRKRKRKEAKNTEIQPLPSSSSSAECSINHHHLVSPTSAAHQVGIGVPNRGASEKRSKPFQDHQKKLDIVKSLASNFILCIQFKNNARPKKRIIRIREAVA